MTETENQYLFVSFRDPGTVGLYLSLSRDGYRWTLLDDGELWIKPEQAGERMRDPFTAPWMEDPFALTFDNHYVVYYDACQRPQHMGAVRSHDLETWEDVSAQLSFPRGLKRDSFLRLTGEEAERLERC